MKRTLAAMLLLLAACSKNDSERAAPTGPTAKTLTMAPLPLYPSYEVWCTGGSKGTCKGGWEGKAPGTSALGPYRFVEVERTDSRDDEGAVRDVYFELQTPRGLAYFALGRTRKGPVTTSVMVKEVVDRPGALELRYVFRSAPRFTYSDYYGAAFILEGAHGLGVVQVALGKIVGDAEGNTQGSIGQAQWQAGKLLLKGATVADGEWAITPPP